MPNAIVTTTDKPTHARILNLLNDPVLPDTRGPECGDCAFCRFGERNEISCEVPDAILCPRIRDALTSILGMAVCECGNRATPGWAHAAGWIPPEGRRKTWLCHNRSIAGTHIGERA